MPTQSQTENDFALALLALLGVDTKEIKGVVIRFGVDETPEITIVRNVKISDFQDRLLDIGALVERYQLKAGRMDKHQGDEVFPA